MPDGKVPPALPGRPPCSEPTLALLMKHRLNVRLSAGLFAGFMVLGVSVHLLHGYQVRRNAGYLLTQADRTEQQGNLRGTTDYLSRYLALVPSDTEARARFGLLLA